MGVCRYRGLIPARAGKTLATTNNTLPVEAHPRAGGENLQDIFDLVSAAGSSPRGRGKPPRGCHRPGARRLIPARAGKTCRHRYLPESPRAHPRAGGENPAMLGSSLQLFGSSPRGRGKLGEGQGQHGQTGLIPARAGKTSSCCARGRALPAHPRAGGENIKAAVSVVVEWGSSPRGRGKRQPASPPLHFWRLIPARAGKT